MADQPWIWISAGETSGDQRAAEFLAELQAVRPAQAFGITGPRLRAAGVETFARMEDLRGIGITEVVRSIPQVLRLIGRCARACERRRPALAILVDYGEFHMRLGKALRKAGIPVFHLAPPKVWAWGQWRVRRLQESADAVGELFPFAAGFFEQHGLKTAQVGHPVAGLLDVQAPGERPWLLLLPGSRPGEIRRHLGLLVAAARRLRRSLPLQPVLGRAPDLDDALFADLPDWLEVRQFSDPAQYAPAGLALAASGTVNLELAALGIPQVVVYKASRGTALVGRILIRTDWLNPVNINAGRPVLRELLQQQATPRRVAAAARETWSRREEIATAGRDVIAAMRRPAGLRDAARLAWSLA